MGNASFTFMFYWSGANSCTTKVGWSMPKSVAPWVLHGFSEIRALHFIHGSNPHFPPKWPYIRASWTNPSTIVIPVPVDEVHQQLTIFDDKIPNSRMHHIPIHSPSLRSPYFTISPNISHSVPILDGQKTAEAEVLNTIGFDQDTFFWGFVSTWIMETWRHGRNRRVELVCHQISTCMNVLL